ncbi:MAG: hypothetical protein ABSF46_25475 [Terriglobia bacterium]|jgi:hypothetical protein
MRSRTKGWVGLGRPSATASHWEGFEGNVGQGPGEHAPPLLDPLESVPHQARLHAFDSVAPPVEPRQVFDLPVPERVARPVSGREFALQSGEPLGIFAEGPHDGGGVFGRRITAVLQGIHFHAFFSGPAAGPGRALGIVPRGVDTPGSQGSRFT